MVAEVGVELEPSSRICWIFNQISDLEVVGSNQKVVELDSLPVDCIGSFSTFSLARS